MLKFGLLLGVGVGALIALLTKEPIAEEAPDPLAEATEESPVKSAVRRIKHQIREAQLASREAASEKEAEMHREFDDALRNEKHT